MSLLSYPCRIWKGKPLLFYQSRGTWQQQHWCTKKRVGFQISLSDLEEGERQPVFCLSFSDQSSCGSECFPSSSLFFCRATLNLVSLNSEISCDICAVLIDVLSFWGYCPFKKFLEIEELSRLACFVLEFTLVQVQHTEIILLKSIGWWHFCIVSPCCTRSDMNFLNQKVIRSLALHFSIASFIKSQ